jgi:tetratricopeptide (TPR) repeat protein
MKSKVIVYIALFSVLAIKGYSQSAAINKADKKYERYAFIDAIKTYERVAEKGYKSVEMFQKLGNSYYFNSEFDKAAKWYGELFAMTQDVDAEYYYRYAQSLKATKQYDKANELMDQFSAKLTDDNRVKIYAANKNYLDVIISNSGRY